SHGIIENGLEILKNLEHRGAVACDDATGDGAGILMQLPDLFLQKIAGDQGIKLPPKGDYACGLVFLPTEESQRTQCTAIVENAARQMGQTMLGWRPVPVNSKAIGAIAREAEPSIFQVFIGRKAPCAAGIDFERRLYLIRKIAQTAVKATDLSQKNMFHVASLSSSTLIYKGMFAAHQLEAYFPDLIDPKMQSAVALVHQRYSTNTFPAWNLAQPFRMLCHNGEINTIQGNRFWLKAREPKLASSFWGKDIVKLMPLAVSEGSDSASLDNLVEFLVLSGRSIPHAVMMLIPEAWQKAQFMDTAKQIFYQYHACMMEPWDGPASVAFCDGRYAGAVLDRNGLRPSRYTLTSDNIAVMASEAGVLQFPASKVVTKGRLMPGRMFLTDLVNGKVIADGEIKNKLAARKPYGQWLGAELVTLSDLPEPPLEKSDISQNITADNLKTWQQAFGYTREDLKLILPPMAQKGKEAIGSMGSDIPTAFLSAKPRLLYDYFKQLFAQVTNPPLDAIREDLVTSMTLYLGAEQNLLDESPAHCRRLKIKSPILSSHQLRRILKADHAGLKARILPAIYTVDQGVKGLQNALKTLFEKALAAINDGVTLLILSDRHMDEIHAPIPALLAVAGLHHHLIRSGRRSDCDLIVESGEPREVHHFCTLLGFGAGAVAPYLAVETLENMAANQELGNTEPKAIFEYYRKAIDGGILKVMSKMGISTLQSYRGAQLFECVGLSSHLVERYFTGTPLRLEGAGLDVLAKESQRRHQKAFGKHSPLPDHLLPSGGKYQWRRDGESHQYTPSSLGLIRKAIFQKDFQAFQSFANEVNERNRQEGFLRGLLKFKEKLPPIALNEVEPWTEIVKRFKTGAMSYGSISKEAHETIAIAMNRIGARSNSGEGGEDADRYHPDANGDWRNSAIKQVASGRFGVTIDYLASAKEIQIKMAQGAKPGEGGQLPGTKVYPWIAKTRFATPGVGLISPPPHHDIYSIEDLAQLIHDLKCANPVARISVKLVSGPGVGTVAAGVAKAGADLVLISGDAGGTGAASLSSIGHAGLPWELGLPEAHTTLIKNGLRHRIALECDGQLKTGQDVALACMLGAEEFGFGTMALVALGCIMMRVCHLNTCPVGIATQDPELRKKFEGKPEHVITLMRFIAEDLRHIMAHLGIRRVADMVGRSDLLESRLALLHWKAKHVDMAPLLEKVIPSKAVAVSCSAKSLPSLSVTEPDRQLLEKARPAVEKGEKVTINLKIRNIHRTLGTRLSHAVTKAHGPSGLPEDTINIDCAGSAGQSFGAFATYGMTFRIKGDANDYFGKGLCGAKMIIQPPLDAGYAAVENILIGNVAFYGATSGQAFINGMAGERFCVRNSGTVAVVEGVGDHALEYMTGGTVVIIGPTGRNTAAGMSGGIAFVLDHDGQFQEQRCNLEMVWITKVIEPEDINTLHDLIKQHYLYTSSSKAGSILDKWPQSAIQFLKIIPKEYQRALEKMKKERG
ncbi:MAG: glutamate synthase large subunit, partial [Desulfobacteraceae bacterium]